MKMADGGNDQPQLIPMVEQIADRYDTVPGAWLADGGFVSLDAVEKLADRRIALYAPPPKPRGGRAAGPRRGDAPSVATWRERMASDEGRAIYQQRAATSEWVNAGARGRGLHQMPVRGRAKARAIALWHASGHNLTRLIAPPAARSARPADLAPSRSARHAARRRAARPGRHRLLAVACAMLAAGTPFDPAHPSKVIDDNSVTPC